MPKRTEITATWGSREGESPGCLLRNSTTTSLKLQLTHVRKTRITLKDSGVRDEHGLEPKDGIFSSPEKPNTKQNGLKQYSTILEDDSMDIGSSASIR